MIAIWLNFTQDPSILLAESYLLHMSRVASWPVFHRPCRYLTANLPKAGKRPVFWKSVSEASIVKIKEFAVTSKGTNAECLERWLGAEFRISRRRRISQTMNDGLASGLNLASNSKPWYNPSLHLWLEQLWKLFIKLLTCSCYAHVGSNPILVAIVVFFVKSSTNTNGTEEQVASKQ